MLSPAVLFFGQGWLEFFNLEIIITKFWRYQWAKRKEYPRTFLGLHKDLKITHGCWRLGTISLSSQQRGWVWWLTPGRPGRRIATSSLPAWALEWIPGQPELVWASASKISNGKLIKGTAKEPVVSVQASRGWEDDQKQLEVTRMHSWLHEGRLLKDYILLLH